ncbi:hypothetical protein HN011_006713 [Eciton burchellii]|nr:hypothetical protein HN011_006713 [Eciton burchellii]
MEENTISIQKSNYQSCKDDRKKGKSGIRKIFRNAWHKIKVMSGSDDERESNNDEAHLLCKYILVYLQ